MHKYGIRGTNMPQLIMSIDEIARRKQRDVIYVKFQNKQPGVQLDYRLNPSRIAILDLFDANGIPYWECGGIACDLGLDSYQGQIYVDVPFDRGSPLFKAAVRLLTLAKTLAEDRGPQLLHLSLSSAMENAHHDETQF